MNLVQEHLSCAIVDFGGLGDGSSREGVWIGEISAHDGRKNEEREASNQGKCGSKTDAPDNNTASVFTDPRGSCVVGGRLFHRAYFWLFLAEKCIK